MPRKTHQPLPPARVCNPTALTQPRRARNGPAGTECRSAVERVIRSRDRCLMLAATNSATCGNMMPPRIATLCRQCKHIIRAQGVLSTSKFPKTPFCGSFTPDGATIAAEPPAGAVASLPRKTSGAILLHAPFCNLEFHRRSTPRCSSFWEGPDATTIRERSYNSYRCRHEP